MPNIAIGIAGGGFSCEDIVNLMPLFAGMSTGGGGAFMPELAIDVADTEIDGDMATCAVSVRFSMDGKTQGESGTMILEKQDGKWYIMNMY